MTSASVELLQSVDDEVVCDLLPVWRLSRELEKIGTSLFALNCRDFAERSQWKCEVSVCGHVYEIDDRQTIGQNEEKLVEQGLQFTRICVPGERLASVSRRSGLRQFCPTKEKVKWSSFSNLTCPGADGHVMIQGSINSALNTN
jgi:hypothetical protein